MKSGEYVNYMKRLVFPVLSAASEGCLKKRLTVEEKAGACRKAYSAFEAVARVLDGIAPWLEAEVEDRKEAEFQREARKMAAKALHEQFCPGTEDYADFENHCYPISQILVECAFLAQAILRAPRALWENLLPETRKNILRVFKLTRSIRPALNNWLLFATEIEAVLKKYESHYEEAEVMMTFRQIQSWYCGDGWYSDGKSFHMDYYNSMVIHPMMIDLCRNFPELVKDWEKQQVMERAVHHAAALERMIGPDGTFLPVGRSLSYRCGVFHLLAMAAQEEWLLPELFYGTVREALGAVIKKTLGTDSYRSDGFLKIGVCAGQPSIGESYISTGSLYYACLVFLPLGLPENHAFWTEPGREWTQKRIWNGENVEADHPLE